MNVRHLAALISMLCATTVRTARGQTLEASAHQGDRIRVQRFDVRHARVGKLVAQSDDSLTVEWSNGARESMPLFAVQRLEVSGEHRHYVKRGMMYGLVMGAALGLVMEKVTTSDSSKYGSRDMRLGSPLIGVATAGGIAFGALAGAMGTESWRSIPVQPSGARTGFKVPSSPARLAIGLTARF
ncbi:MAG: hypothetical protein JF589_14720 [Gemmatimonadetes bacterium]|nr:hypothetical protein [Gemmatimonadota bacterium]